jgi:hypothetical protein
MGMMCRRLGLAVAVLAAAGCTTDAGDKPFPNLADVPARPSVAPAEERQDLLDRLLEDRAAGQALAPSR